LALAVILICHGLLAEITQLLPRQAYNSKRHHDGLWGSSSMAFKINALFVAAKKIGRNHMFNVENPASHEFATSAASSSAPLAIAAAKCRK